MCLMDLEDLFLRFVCGGVGTRFWKILFATHSDFSYFIKKDKI